MKQTGGKNRFTADLVRGIQFLYEQDGIPEREFKEAVIPVLKHQAHRAYLAKVKYVDTGMEAVALCLRAVGAEETLVRPIGEAFSAMFGPDAHLDIIFLSEQQERELGRVCRAFFENASNQQVLS